LRTKKHHSRQLSQRIARTFAFARIYFLIAEWANAKERASQPKKKRNFQKCPTHDKKEKEIFHGGQFHISFTAFFGGQQLCKQTNDK
jgi:hypothetical protein